MVPLVHGLGEGQGPGRFLDSAFGSARNDNTPVIAPKAGRLFVISTKAVRPRGEISEKLLHQPQYALFHHFLIQVRHDREGHARGDEEGAGEAAEVLRLDAADGGGSAQDGQAQGMSLEEHAFELVQDDAPLGLDLGVGEGGLRRQLEEQAGGLPEVLLQHGGVQDDLLLGGVGV